MAAEPTDVSETEAGRRGAFVVLDGPDGGGKTTQAANLAEWLRTQGREVVTCRDPGGTAVGDKLRAILLDRDTIGLSVRTEMLLFMTSRAQLVEEIIRPAMAAGKVVISDRYLLANEVYQGYAGGLDVHEIGLVGQAATGGLMPDLTLVLDVPLDVARTRVSARSKDRIEDRSEEYHARVREGFLRAAEEARNGRCGYYPGRVVVVDGHGDTGAVATRIRSEVERALALDPRG